MKIKTLTALIFLITMISCNQSHEPADQNSPAVDTLYQDQTMESAAVPDQNNGVFFVNIKDGDSLKSPVIIQMGVTGMQVEPAGKIAENTGHHHLIVDGSFIEKGTIIPADATHIHFGKGQTTDTLQLNPGKHTLTLQFANGMHESYGKDWSNTIGITILK